MLCEEMNVKEQILRHLVRSLERVNKLSNQWILDRQLYTIPNRNKQAWRQLGTILKEGEQAYTSARRQTPLHQLSNNLVQNDRHTTSQSPLVEALNDCLRGPFHLLLYTLLYFTSTLRAWDTYTSTMRMNYNRQNIHAELCHLAHNQDAKSITYEVTIMHETFVSFNILSTLLD